FFNGAIRNKKRFTYDQVQGLLDEMASGGRSQEDRGQKIEDRKAEDISSSLNPSRFAEGTSSDLCPLSSDITAMLRRMRDLALLLRKKRFKRGSLELTMPEAVLEYDDQGRVSGAHFAEHNLSHQIIEEFMLAANEAVAEHFTKHDIPFLRRVHPAPNEEKL